MAFGPGNNRTPGQSSSKQDHSTLLNLGVRLLYPDPTDQTRPPIWCLLLPCCHHRLPFSSQEPKSKARCTFHLTSTFLLFLLKMSPQAAADSGLTTPKTPNPNAARDDEGPKSRFGAESAMSLLVDSLKDRLLLAVPKKGRLMEKTLELLAGELLGKEMSMRFDAQAPTLNTTVLTDWMLHLSKITPLLCKLQSLQTTDRY